MVGKKTISLGLVMAYAALLCALCSMGGPPLIIYGFMRALQGHKFEDVKIMHGQNVEFGNLIPGKFCIWREIFAILRRNVSLRCILHNTYFCLFLSFEGNLPFCPALTMAWDGF